MVKKKNSRDKNTALIIVAFIIGIAIATALILGGILGWFGMIQFGDINILEQFNRDPDAECTFTIEDNTVCIRNNVTGTLNANSPVCYIGYNYNNEGWRFAGIIDEVSPGLYQESRQATVLGHYVFAAICGTPADFCRTNDVEVDVINCDDDTPAYTCGWAEDQCGGTCPTTHPLCVDMWYEDNVLFGDNSYVFCACINPDDETVHPDWKPDGQYHDDEGPFPNGEPALNCIDSDGVNVFTVGTTTYLGVSHPDVCHAGAYYAVDEYVCIDDVAVKKEIQCPYGPVGGCADGRCVTGTTTVYNECLNIGYANGGGCYSGDNPVAHPELDLFCGDLYPLNHAICFN